MMVKDRPSFISEEDLTYKLIGIFIEISRNYGYSFKEREYQKLTTLEFEKRDIKYKSQPRVILYGDKLN